MIHVYLGPQGLSTSLATVPAVAGPGDSSREVAGHACSIASTPRRNVPARRLQPRVGRGRPRRLDRPCAFPDVSGVTEPTENSRMSGSMGEWLSAPVSIAPPAGARASSLGAMGAAGGMTPAHSAGRAGPDPARIPPPAVGGQ